MSETNVIPMTDQPVIINLTAEQLVISPYNMRGSDTATPEQSDAGLSASIYAYGIAQNLVVHDLGDGTYGVAAGGRRWKAVSSLIVEGKLPADYPIPCKLVTTDQARGVSIAENRMREQPHPADEFVAFRELLDEGFQVATVAEQFGVSPTYVRQRLALAKVHPEILAAFRQDKIRMDMVKAYTLTDDQDLQLRVFKQPGVYGAYRVRELIQAQKPTTDTREFRYVGTKAYEKAGGLLGAEDLFDAAGPRTVENPEILQQLLDARLAKYQAKLEKEGWSWVQVSFDRPDGYYDFARLDMTFADPELRAEHGRLVAEETRLEDEGSEEEYEAAVDALIAFNNEHGRAEKVWSDEQKAMAGAIAFVDYNGKLDTRRGVYKPTAQKSASGGSEGDSGNYSNAVLQDLRYLRQQGLKVHLMDYPGLVEKVMQFCVCDRVFGKWSYDRQSLPLKFSLESTSHFDTGQLPDNDLKDIAGQLELDDIWPDIDVPADRPNQAERFTRFAEQPSHVRLRQYTFAVLSTLHAPLSDPDEDSVLTRALAMCAEQPGWHALIRLTNEDFFKRINKPQLVALAKEYLSEADAKKYSSASKGELAAYLADQLWQNNRMLWLPEEITG